MYGVAETKRGLIRNTMKSIDSKEFSNRRGDTQGKNVSWKLYVPSGLCTGYGPLE